ncbi:hypothetical protein SAMN04487897_10482 [Paenibacillus sp. yr247]|nr:hypothetical protein SAMN04487897_10482 [Paenibacillus sp. yr247]
MGFGWPIVALFVMFIAASMAGIDYSVALFADPLLASVFGYASSNTTVLIAFTVILLSHGILNHIGIGIVSKLNDFSAWYHIAISASIIYLKLAKRFPISRT